MRIRSACIPVAYYYGTEDEDGRTDWQCGLLAAARLAVTRDGEAREHGRLLRVEHLDGGAHEWAMPMSLLAGDGVGYREHLLSLGLRIAAGQRARGPAARLPLDDAAGSAGRAASARGFGTAAPTSSRMRHRHRAR